MGTLLELRERFGMLLKETRIVDDAMQNLLLRV